MKMDAQKSVLLIIDVQEKLLPAMHEKEQVLENTIWMTKLANLLEVPVIASEQYPKGLGPTIDELRKEFPEGAVGEKTDFSCTTGGCITPLPGSDRKQVIICGIESHVCVLQTALDLIAEGREVFVLNEGVSSRKPEDKALALERMRTHGVQIVSREMVAFEWLGGAKHPKFREVSKEFVR